MENDLIHLDGKRVLIRVDGSHAIGLGHVCRMKALALALQSAGSQVFFLTKSDAVVSKVLKNSQLSFHDFQASSYQEIRREVLRKYQPDLIIQDVLETSSGDMAEFRFSPAVKIINLDDVYAGLIMADIVINSLVFHSGMYKVHDVQARLFEGPRYMILNAAIREYAQHQKLITERAEKILLAFGGTDTHYMTERALQAINKIETRLTVTINVGPGGQSSPGLEQAAQESHHQIRMLYGVPDLFNELFLSDLVVCAGGVMLYELAAMGVPSICVPTELHEVHNADYWSGVGTIETTNYEKDFDPAQLTEAVINLLPDYRRRSEMSVAGKRSIDPFGLDRVLRIIDEAVS